MNGVRRHLFVLLLAALASACATAGPGGQGLERIGHIIVIYQENWSFDSLYGRFPGANGLANAGGAAIQTDRGGKPYDVLPRALGADRKPDPRIPEALGNRPFDLEPYVKPGEKAGNPLHNFYQNQHQINGGRNDRFVAWTDAGALTMSYYDATNLPEGRLAREYTLADNFFQGAFGGSFLNHIWLACACTPEWKGAPADMRAQLDGQGFVAKDGAVTPDGFVVNTSYTVNTPHPANADPKRLVPSLAVPTIGDRLSAKSVSWAWYSGGWSDAVAGRPHPVFQFHHQPFAYFATYADGTEARRQHLSDEQEFLAALRDATLPAVSFVKPLGPLNEHPGYADLLSGQEHVMQLVAAIRASPVWKDTVIVITYDEFGGRWDHVAPPKADRWGPGTRIPAIVVSPFAKRGYVDHTLYDTTSILKLIERRYALEPVTTRNVGDLTNALELQ